MFQNTKDSEYNTSWYKIGKVFLIAAVSFYLFYVFDDSELLNKVFNNPKKSVSSRRFMGFMVLGIMKYVLLISTAIFAGLGVFLIYKRNHSNTLNR